MTLLSISIHQLEYIEYPTVIVEVALLKLLQNMRKAQRFPIPIDSVLIHCQHKEPKYGFHYINFLLACLRRNYSKYRYEE